MTDAARCDAEIAACKAELRAGHPDIDGLMLGLHDWRAEKRMLEGEAGRKFRIIEGDAWAVLGTMPDARFSACFCDPPYGLGFMGKAWDHGVPGPEVWREVLRVLKPGAPLMAFGGTRTYHRLACAIEDAGFNISDTLMWLHGQGFPKGHAQLKPAWEPITLAWKKGARVLAIDAARVGAAGGTVPTIDGRPGLSVNAFGNGLNNRRGVPVAGLGRWPANVLLDEEAAAMLDEQSGESKSIARIGKRIGRNGGLQFGMAEQVDVEMGHSDSGGASRFFYVAKADPAERYIGGKCDHPTVKPLDLCAYLAKLILPPEGERRLLVPFSGAGSEIMGALRAGWEDVLGIEISPEYCLMARNRITQDAPLFNQEQPEPPSMALEAGEVGG